MVDPAMKHSPHYYPILDLVETLVQAMTQAPRDAAMAANCALELLAAGQASLLCHWLCRIYLETASFAWLGGIEHLFTLVDGMLTIAPPRATHGSELSVLMKNAGLVDAVFNFVHNLCAAPRCSVLRSLAGVLSEGSAFVAPESLRTTITHGPCRQQFGDAVLPAGLLADRLIFLATRGNSAPAFDLTPRGNAMMGPFEADEARLSRHLAREAAESTDEADEIDERAPFLSRKSETPARGNGSDVFDLVLMSMRAFFTANTQSDALEGCAAIVADYMRTPPPSVFQLSRAGHELAVYGHTAAMAFANAKTVASEGQLCSQFFGSISAAHGAARTGLADEVNYMMKLACRLAKYGKQTLKCRQLLVLLATLLLDKTTRDQVVALPKSDYNHLFARYDRAVDSDKEERAKGNFSLVNNSLSGLTSHMRFPLQLRTATRHSRNGRGVSTLFDFFAETIRRGEERAADWNWRVVTCSHWIGTGAPDTPNRAAPIGTLMTPVLFEFSARLDSAAMAFRDPFLVFYVRTKLLRECDAKPTPATSSHVLFRKTLDFLNKKETELTNSEVAKMEAHDRATALHGMLIESVHPEGEPDYAPCSLDPCIGTASWAEKTWREKGRRVVVELGLGDLIEDEKKSAPAPLPPPPSVVPPPLPVALKEDTKAPAKEKKKAVSCETTKPPAKPKGPPVVGVKRKPAQPATPKKPAAKPAQSASQGPSKRRRRDSGVVYAREEVDVLDELGVPFDERIIQLKKLVRSMPADKFMHEAEDLMNEIRGCASVKQAEKLEALLAPALHECLESA